jgi:AmiR/NasT family two-component response regulator
MPSEAPATDFICIRTLVQIARIQISCTDSKQGAHLDLPHVFSASMTDPQRRLWRCSNQWQSFAMESRNTTGKDIGNPGSRFLELAQKCRVRDLQQLVILGGLVRALGAFIHALQKERGASSIYAGSNGKDFGGKLRARVAECRMFESAARAQIGRIDQQLEHAGNGLRFFGRMAAALVAWDNLEPARDSVVALQFSPQQAVKYFSDLIASLLAVSFEAADVAADPAISRALIALVNFAQGKEYAGQERAVAGGAFSSGQWLPHSRERMMQLLAAQERAFHIFTEFATPAQVTAFKACDADSSTREVQELRRLALDSNDTASPSPQLSARWYEATTRRIDRMRLIEDEIAHELEALCSSKLAEALLQLHEPALGRELPASTAMTVLMTDPQNAADLYPVRSILDVVQAQSRRIDSINTELESARAALAERKVIERAKGLLMRSRRLSEKEAYSLLRQTAMNQNKRLFEIAEAVISMEDLLR